MFCQRTNPARAAPSGTGVPPGAGWADGRDAHTTPQKIVCDNSCQVARRSDFLPHDYPWFAVGFSRSHALSETNGVAHSVVVSAARLIQSSAFWMSHRWPLRAGKSKPLSSSQDATRNTNLPVPHLPPRAPRRSDGATERRSDGATIHAVGSPGKASFFMAAAEV